jgi:TonB family protein
MMDWQTVFSFPDSANWILLTAFHSLWLSFAALLLMRLLKYRSSVVRATWGTFTLMALLILPLITWFIPRLVVHTQYVNEAAMGMGTGVVEIPAPLVNGLLDLKTPLPQSYMDRWKVRMNQVGVLWLAITLISVGRLLYQLAFLKGYCTGLQEIHDDRISAVLRGDNYSFRFRGKPRFFASNKLASPISTGILTPLVILPVVLYRSVGDNELRAILLHELAHIYHHDHMLGLLQRIMKALYWWNPFVYSLCNSLSVAREEVSDNHAISGMGSASSYASLLVSLVDKTALISRLPCTAGLGTPYELLETRIRNIVSRRRDLRVKISKRKMLLILLTAVLLCGVVVIGSQVAVFGTAYVPASVQKMNEPKAALTLGKSISRESTIIDNRLLQALVHNVAPIYPEKGIKAHIQSKVELEVAVTEKGLVWNVRATSGNPFFTEVALKAVKQWRFYPSVITNNKADSVAPVSPPFKLAPSATIKGVPFRTTIMMEFSLCKNDSTKIVISASKYKLL